MFCSIYAPVAYIQYQLVNINTHLQCNFFLHKYKDLLRCNADYLHTVLYSTTLLVSCVTAPNCGPGCAGQHQWNSNLSCLAPTSNQQLWETASHKQCVCNFITISISLLNSRIKHSISNYLSIKQSIFRDTIIVLSTALRSILGELHKFCNLTVYYFFHFLRGEKKTNSFLRHNGILG